MSTERRLKGRPSPEEMISLAEAKLPRWHRGSFFGTRECPRMNHFREVFRTLLSRGDLGSCLEELAVHEVGRAFVCRGTEIHSV